MFSVKACPLPENTLLAPYARKSDHYTDCFMVDVPGKISLAEFVNAFYTTWLFKLERIILKWAVKRPSTDEDAIGIARGEQDRFAAWTTEKRTGSQLLMCAIGNRTRSWFMVEEGKAGNTRLYFGSAVIPEKIQHTGKPATWICFQGTVRISQALFTCPTGRGAAQIVTIRRSEIPHFQGKFLNPDQMA